MLGGVRQQLLLANQPSVQEGVESHHALYQIRSAGQVKGGALGSGYW